MYYKWANSLATGENDIAPLCQRCTQKDLADHRLCRQAPSIEPLCDMQLVQVERGSERVVRNADEDRNRHIDGDRNLTGKKIERERKGRNREGREKGEK